MTPAEKQRLAYLKEERDIARALSWPNFPKPEPMLVPEDPRETIFGWAVDVFREVVDEESQTSEGNFTTAGAHRDLRPLYATESEALLVLYYELCWQYGKTLAELLKLAKEKEG